MRYDVQKTEACSQWLAAMRDLRAKVAVLRRIERASEGNLGDIRSLGQGISEMKIDVGPGYRVYFTFRGAILLILLCRGSKATQASDIMRARKLAGEV